MHSPIASAADGWLVHAGTTPVGAPAHASGRREAAWIAGTVIASVVVLLTTGNPTLATLPALVAATVYAVWRAPLRHTLLLYVFIVGAVFAPPANLANGPVWDVLRPANDALFGGLHKATGIGALVITGSELVCLLLLALMLVRVVRGSRIDVAGRTPGSNVVAAASAVALAAVLLLIVWGAVRGGDVRRSLLQFRQLLFIPFMTLLFTYALRDVRDFARIAVALTAAVFVKIALGVFYFAHDVWPATLKPLKLEFMTGHHDTVPYVVMLFAWCAAAMHAPKGRQVTPALLLVVGWIGTGIVLNNRRVAYVSLFASFLVLYVLVQGQRKRRVTRAIVCALPFLAAYVLVARSHPTGIFKPAAALWSVGDQTNTSNVWRETENADLLFTLKESWVLGTGWGHEYIEVIKLPDISRFYPQYRLAPHNSVLWLLGVAGLGGFVMLWTPLVVGIYLAARSYRVARTPMERTAAVSALSVFVAYAIQAWGDMGVLGAVPAMMMAGALALSGKLARATGAWPSGVRVASTASPPPNVLPAETPPFGPAPARLPAIRDFGSV